MGSPTLHANYEIGDVYTDAVDPDMDQVREHGEEQDDTLTSLIATRGGLLNHELSSSVAGNALTIALKNGADGGDPAAASPVRARFRSATASDGAWGGLQIEVALSLTVPATATLGASDGEPFTLVVGVFNDGGTARLGVVNRPGALDNRSLASATAIDGSADSPGVIYAGSAVSSKPLALVGRLTWSSGLTTAGVYDTAPDIVETFGEGQPLPALPACLHRLLIADDTGGQNINTAQPWFPTLGSVTLQPGTYLFEGELHLSRAAGTTSHTTATLFGGTATLGDIDYFAMAKTGDANDLQAWSGFRATDETATVVKAASTSATEQALIWVRGRVKVTAAGTLIPEFQYSAAPGGAPTVKAGSCFRLEQVPDYSDESAGVWS